MKNQKGLYLVTGATGHVGNVLSHLLDANGYQLRLMAMHGEDITPISDIDAEIVYCDVTKKEEVEQAVYGVEGVFHLAGMISIIDGQSKKLYDVNVNGVKNVVESCLKYKIKRLVHVSSVHALSEAPQGQVLEENFDFRPGLLLGDYAKSKALGSIEVLKGIHQGLDAVILFPSGIVGPFDYQSFGVSKLMEGAIKHPKLMTKMYFEGAYDFVDVRDVAKAIVSAMEKGKKGEGYLVTGNKVTLKDLFVGIRAALNITGKLIKIPATLVRFAAKFMGMMYRMFKISPVLTPYAVDVLCSNPNMDCSKAKRELGVSVRPFSATIEDSITWLKHRNLMKKNQKRYLKEIRKEEKRVKRAHQQSAIEMR